MPFMDGIKFQEALRTVPKYKDTPFLFVSGHDDEQTLKAITLSKHNGFMTKTKPLSELKAWISYLMTPPERRPSLPPRTEQKFDFKNRTRREYDSFKKN